MKVAIIGKSRISNIEESNFLTKAQMIADVIVKNGHVLLTGACHGYPLLVANYVYLNGGMSIGYSPGFNITEHKIKYNSPVGHFNELIFVGGGLMKREVELVLNADLLIALDGNIGTLTEILMSIKENKNVIVLSDFKHFEINLKELLRSFVVYPKPQIEFLGLEETLNKLIN